MKKEKMLKQVDELMAETNLYLLETGHTDVVSMKNKVKIAMSALQKMQSELGKLGDEDSLPTWWTNKVATAVSRLDDMSDYLDTQIDEEVPGNAIGQGGVDMAPNAGPRLKVMNVTDRRRRKDKQPVMLKRFRKYVEEN